MPTRSRTAAKTAVEVVEPEEAQDALPGLQFNETLSWRAGRPIAVAELLRRLQALSKELREMDQEEHDRTSFTKVAKELVGQGLLGHKDKGIRAWTACCLVDILRLCAPDAPFTGAQLKAWRDIFGLFVTSILPSLSDPSSAYNTQHLYVLQSLAQVKSIVLLTDIPSSEPLILSLFTSFFDILSGSSRSSTGEQIGKNTEYHMTAILVILVDEAPSLPPEVVDIIVAQFLRTDPRALTNGATKGKRNGMAPVDDRQSTLLLKELPPAYSMAKAVCNSCPEKMARHVSQYFNDVILDASSSAAAADGAAKGHLHRKAAYAKEDSDSDEGPVGPSEDDLTELRKAHRLLRELWRASPGVLQNVIPQLSLELSAENVQLRLLATETLGDIISGIGAAGPPPPPTMDPSAYPPTTLATSSNTILTSNVLTTPLSPQSFMQAHPAAYHGFLSRRNDKSALIRSAWITSVGQILTTSAGGIGLSQSDEQMLVKDLAHKLADADERVRIAAIKSVGRFGFHDTINKLGSTGGIDKEGSVLNNLAGRARDRKHNVRAEGMTTLGQLWAVGCGELRNGNELVKAAIGSIPSKLLDTFYVNDLDINVLLDHVLFEQLVPLSYPSSKQKASKPESNDPLGSQKLSQGSGDMSKDTFDADKIRIERVLHLVKDLDDKAKKAFFAVQGRQVQLSRIMQAFLKRCEEYNGGIIQGSEADVKSNLGRLIDWLAKTLPDSPRVSADLWKFAKMHDRRNYQLLRFCMDPNSDYRTVHKAIKELTKRIEAAPGSPAGMLDTMRPLLYRLSLLIYNKSHVPAIVGLSRTDDGSLSSTAHEVLKEMSTRNPEVFKAHVSELCRLLEDQAPTAKKANEPGTVDTLKACARFAQKFPNEVPQDRKFLQSLVNFTIYGTPPAAAKHAVTIIMAAADRREMYAKDMVQRSIKDFKFGHGNFLTRLATLSQLMLMAPKEVEEENDAVFHIAIEDILLKVRTPAQASDPEWVSGAELDDEGTAKLWALKTLANRLRSDPDPSTVKEIARPVLKLLSTLIENEGELSKKKDTPLSHKPHLRLLAGQLFLKLCSTTGNSTRKTYDDLLEPDGFNRLAFLSQASQPQVRTGFVNKLKKYLGQGHLSQRFYTIPFLLAYEPQQAFRLDTVTWIRSRVAFFGQQQKPIMESVFARLLSLLAHHPDFSTTPDDLADFARYILFYLQPVATEENLPLIYFVAQRVKQTRDAIDPEYSENLYYLSDLAQSIIRRYEDVQGWAMQTWPGKMRLPSSLFAALPSHEVAQEIATRTYLPDELEDQLDNIVKAKLKQQKKRKSIDPYATSSHHTNGRSKKRKGSFANTHINNNNTTLPIRKSSSKRIAKPKDSRKRAATRTREGASDAIPSSEQRRRSSRHGAPKVGNYRELSDDDEEEEEGEDDVDMETSDRQRENEEQEDDGTDDEESVEEGEEIAADTVGATKGKAKAEKNVERKSGPIKAVDEANEDDDEEGDLSSPPASDSELDDY
ncbi:MAG: hypothetical protein M1837_004981 [Sclerophora amabilis]|nr:MAG: hypothetical protein M1837_004981 [Sclerophora amabilis]